ncbi:hypothetical protein PENSUB_12503 [Penicillium subrubescens]|uniref:Uncharacterized protein n=1 Tax=Penicillium subrubescens TaxID=1316194 RepID=A0A1Q5SZR8_9EURO|nr:hypothetical protein PENSUB_12503 [Penicillium subrubescens]
MASLLHIRQGLQQYSVRIEYLKPLAKYNREKPYLLGLDIPLADESGRSNLEFESITLKAADARIVRDRLSVECHGFELLTLPPEVMARHFDHNDKRLEMEGVHAILANKFKTDKVIVYDHALLEAYSPENPKGPFAALRPTIYYN